MKDYESDNLRHAKEEVQANFGYVLMVFGGTTIYSHRLPEQPEEVSFSERESESDLPILLN